MIRGAIRTRSRSPRLARASVRRRGRISGRVGPRAPSGRDLKAGRTPARRAVADPAPARRTSAGPAPVRRGQRVRAGCRGRGRSWYAGRQRVRCGCAGWPAGSASGALGCRRVGRSCIGRRYAGLRYHQAQVHRAQVRPAWVPPASVRRARTRRAQAASGPPFESSAPRGTEDTSRSAAGEPADPASDITPPSGFSSPAAFGSAGGSDQTAVFGAPGSAATSGNTGGRGPDGPGGSGAYGAAGSADGPGGSGAYRAAAGPGRRTGWHRVPRRRAALDGPGRQRRLSRGGRAGWQWRLRRGRGVGRRAGWFRCLPRGGRARRQRRVPPRRLRVARLRPRGSARLRRRAGLRPTRAGPAGAAPVRPARLRAAGPRTAGLRPAARLRTPGPARLRTRLRPAGPARLRPTVLQRGLRPARIPHGPAPRDHPAAPARLRRLLQRRFRLHPRQPGVHAGARVRGGRCRCRSSSSACRPCWVSPASRRVRRRPSAPTSARSFSASGIVVILGLVLGAILTAILFTVLRGAVIGRRTDLGSAWKAALPKVPGLIGVSVLLGLFFAIVAVVGVRAGDRARRRDRRRRRGPSWGP